MGQGEGLDITRRTFVRGGSLALSGLALGACRHGAPSPGRPSGDEDGGSRGEPMDEAPLEADVAATIDPLDGFEQRVDLLEQLDLADVEHQGLFIDFGSPSVEKYILGRWRSGWGNDDRDGERAFTWAEESPARLFFHLDRPEPLRLLLHARPEGVSRLSFYVNDDQLTHLRLPGGWSEQEVEVSASALQAGENILKIVHSNRSGTRSFGLDWLRIVPAEAVGRAFAPPTWRQGVLELRAPTRLSYFLEVPASARLTFGAQARQAPAEVSVRLSDGRTGESRTSVEQIQAGGWKRGFFDLENENRQVVRLDLEVRGEEGTEVHLAALRLLAPATFATPLPYDPVQHVVVVLVDTLRADRLRSYNPTSRVESPEMESFVQGATLFERAQAPSNWTKPSCASLLTGLHPRSHRALTEGGALPRSVTLCSEIYQREGFRTGAFIANGYLAADFGFNRGWHQYRNYIRERRPTEAEHVYADALRWMERYRQERVFLYVHTIDPHVPYDPPEEDLRLYDPASYRGPVRPRSTGFLLEDIKRERVRLSSRDRARLEALYDGEVTYHDRHFGRFIARLGELGVLDSTLIVVASDHGEEFFEHESVGHGHSLYQELLHVPLIMRGPGVSAQRLGQASSLVDVTPTILEAAGLPLPAEMEGRSLLPDLQGQPPPELGASFSSHWDSGNDRELSWAVRLGDWKLRMRGPAQRFLYDLVEDPEERRDCDRDRPLALRAARIALGGFLATLPSRRRSATPASRGRPEADMTPELCEQLRALGYLNVESCQ